MKKQVTEEMTVTQRFVGDDGRDMVRMWNKGKMTEMEAMSPPPPPRRSLLWRPPEEPDMKQYKNPKSMSSYTFKDGTTVTAEQVAAVTGVKLDQAMLRIDQVHNGSRDEAKLLAMKYGKKQHNVYL